MSNGTLEIEFISLFTSEMEEEKSLLRVRKAVSSHWRSSLFKDNFRRKLVGFLDILSPWKEMSNHSLAVTYFTKVNCNKSRPV